MKMTPELLAAILNTGAPIIRDIIAKHHAATGQLPTDAEIQAALSENISAYLAEGAAWSSAHPSK